LVWSLTALLQGLPRANETRRGDLIAEEALSLMRRAMQVGMPEKFPEKLERKVPEHVIDEYYGYHRTDPASGFFNPPFIRWRDRKLYRACTKFWKIPPGEMIGAVPYLDKAYFKEEGPLQVAIIRLVRNILEAAYESPEQPVIAGQVYLDLLERSTDRAHRKAVLAALGNTSGYPADAVRRLMTLASERDREDPELRAVEVMVIVECTYRGSVSDESIVEYVFRIAAGDSCDFCRGWAINEMMVKRYGKERVLPIYLRILEEGVDHSSLSVKTAIREVGMDGKHPEGVPYLIRLLGATNPVLRIDAIDALEATLGRDPKSMDYTNDEEIVWRAKYDYSAAANAAFERGEVRLPAYYPADFDASVMEALGRMVGRWKQWWQTDGLQYLKEHSITTPSEDSAP
jgi:hypothetical protein